MQRRSFTLLEICVCLLLLSLVGGLVTFQMKKMIEHHQLVRGVESLVSQVNALRVVAMARQTDISVEIFEAEGNIYYRKISEDPELTFISARSSLLQGVTQFYRGEVKPSFSPLTRLDITLHSTGRVEPSGLTTFYKNETTQVSVDFSHAHAPKQKS